MKTLFVTGGAGFIGSAFVRAALDHDPGCTIINFDALTYAGNLNHLASIDARRHRFIRGDIADRQAVLEALPAETDAIVHLAAESHVDRSIASADAFLRTNVIGTQVLLDAARERGVKRFLHVSTDEVLGSLNEGEPAFTEAAPIAPNNPYAASKAAAEHLVRAARNTFDLDAIITRCGNNYGPRQYPEKLIPLAITRARADEPIPVYGDGTQVRDWIHVDDHCRALLAVLVNGRPGGTYHIGARDPRRNLDVIEVILEWLGKPRSLIRFGADRPGHDRRYAIDPGKLEREIGWRPRIRWDDGLAHTVRWYRQSALPLAA